MVRWNLKSCPRCGGDLFIYKDLYGWREECLQCGHSREAIDITELKQQRVEIAADNEAVSISL